MQVFAVESDIFQGRITAIAIDAVCNFRAASQDRTGVARLNIFRPCYWIANLHKSDAFKRRITSHLQSIFLKLIHFPLITHLSGQSHVIYKPRPIGDNILARPAGY